MQMVSPSDKLRILVVESDTDLRELIADYFRREGFEAQPIACTEEALRLVTGIPTSGEHLDVITSDIGGHDTCGVKFLRHIRGLPDELLLVSGLRLRHLPFVIVSAQALENEAEVKAIDGTVQMLPKPFSPAALVRLVANAIGTYRHSLLSELEFLGLGISWHGGQFRVQATYGVPQAIESKYFKGSTASWSRTYQRIVLITNRSSIMRTAIDAFEELLNISDTTERDLHEFIERHPFLLLGEEYDSYWSEPRLVNSFGQHLRPDFVLQPLARRTKPWNWAVVDLKRHKAAILASKRLHPDVSGKVYHLVTQLRDYGEYFADPRNSDSLKRIFAGIVPRPKLVGVIGRRVHMVDVFGKLLARVPDVTLLTYDDIIEVRRARAEHLQAVGF